MSEAYPEDREYDPQDCLPEDDGSVSWPDDERVVEGFDNGYDQ